MTRPSELFEVFARHFSEADEPEKAAEYLLKAGDAARALHADQVALDHYSRARVFLARMGDDRRARDTLFKMALAHHLAFDFERAEEVLDEAFCCRVEEAPRLVPTERLETSFHRPSTLSPGDVYSTDEMQIAEHLFRGLLTVDEETNVLPDLADNFRVSKDGRTYLFRLREGLRWSDGVPLTAEDFVYAWRRIREDGLRMAAMLADVEAAEALDDRTLEVTLREPRSYFPYVLASTWAFPWPRHHCEALGAAWHEPENLVCNGPFVIGECSDEGLQLSPNPHWNGPRGNVREVAIAFRLMGPKTLGEWRDGRYDVLQAYDRSAVDAPETESEIVPQLSMHYVGYRADRPPFSSELVRRAFSHAVDRSRLAGVFGDLALPAVRGGAIPPAMPGHSHRVPPSTTPSSRPATRGGRVSGRPRAARDRDGRPEMDCGRRRSRRAMEGDRRTDHDDAVANATRHRFTRRSPHLDQRLGGRLSGSRWVLSRVPDGGPGRSTATTRSRSCSNRPDRSEINRSAYGSTTRSIDCGFASTRQSFRSCIRERCCSAGRGWRAFPPTRMKAHLDQVVIARP